MKSSWVPFQCPQPTFEPHILSFSKLQLVCHTVTKCILWKQRFYDIYHKIKPVWYLVTTENMFQWRFTRCTYLICYVKGLQSRLTIAACRVPGGKLQNGYQLLQKLAQVHDRRPKGLCWKAEGARGEHPKGTVKTTAPQEKQKEDSFPFLSIQATGLFPWCYPNPGWSFLLGLQPTYQAS